MVRKQGRKKLIVAAAILGVLLIAVGTVALIRALGPQNPDPYVQENTTTSESTEESVETEEQKEETKPSVSTEAEEASSIDPATLSIIDVPTMLVTVSYVKGVGPFEYQVLKTPNGTQYVEFRSTELIGTKCTNDEGAFASIIKDPSTTEASATISKTVEVESVKYGLSLSGSNCTSNTELLSRYQQSFSDAFTLLKKTN